jgi:molybdopterin-guanine dinucleotide biosynthesis protein B
MRTGNEPLAGAVDEVVAVVTNGDDAGHEHVFRPNQVDEIANFIEERFIAPDRRRTRGRAGRVSLSIGGQALPLKNWVQEALAGTVLGFVAALKKPEGMDDREVVLRISSRRQP